jgi:hypothetical protein
MSSSGVRREPNELKSKFCQGDPLTFGKKVALGGVGIAALTAIAIGALALLSAYGTVNLDVISSISTKVATALVVGGSAALFVDALAMSYLSGKHRKWEEDLALYYPNR